MESFKKYVRSQTGAGGYPKSVWKRTKGGRVEAKRTYALKKLLIVLIVLVISALILAWLNKFLISWYPVWQAADIFLRGLNLANKYYQWMSRVRWSSAKRNKRYNKCSEAATRGVLWKKVFLEISQNSQQNTCGRVSFLIKLQALGPQLY